jgi:hypothetical protein
MSHNRAAKVATPQVRHSMVACTMVAGTQMVAGPELAHTIVSAPPSSDIQNFVPTVAPGPHISWPARIMDFYL